MTRRAARAKGQENKQGEELRASWVVFGVPCVFEKHRAGERSSLYVGQQGNYMYFLRRCFSGSQSFHPISENTWRYFAFLISLLVTEYINFFVGVNIFFITFYGPCSSKFQIVKNFLSTV